MEYLQWLWNKVIVEGAKGSQIIGSKCREAFSEDDVDHWSSKKAKRKQPARYQGDMGIKVEGTNLCKRCMHTRQDCLVHNSR